MSIECSECERDARGGHSRGCSRAQHLKIGDSAATMRLACGEPIKDACWTQNPNDVSCAECGVTDVDS